MEITKKNILKFNAAEEVLQNNFTVIQAELQSLKDKIILLENTNITLDKKINSIPTYHPSRSSLVITPIISQPFQEEVSYNPSQKQIKQNLHNLMQSSDVFKPFLDRQNEGQQKKQEKQQQQLFKSQQKSEFSFIKGNKTNKINKNNKQNKNNQKSNQITNALPFQSEFSTFIENLAQKIQILEDNQNQNNLEINKLNQQNEQLKLAIKRVQLNKKKQKIEKQNKIKLQKEDKIQQKNYERVLDEMDDKNIDKQVFQNNLALQGGEEDERILQICKFLNEKMKMMNLDINKLVYKTEQLQKNDSTMSKVQEAMIKELQKNQEIKNISNINRRTTDKESRLNQTMESNRAYYEDKLIELLDDMDRIKRQFLSILEKSNEDENEPKDIDRHNRMIKIKQMGSKSDQSLKKQINICKSEVKKLRHELQQIAYGINTGDMKTYIIKPNQNKEDWKDLSTKIYKTRLELLSMIKQLEGKINMNNDLIINMNELEVNMGECKLMIKRKIQASDFEKAIKRLQNRLNNFIRQIYQKEGISNEHEAMMAKQPWFCLSCDSQLKTYTGKIMKALQAEKIQGRKVNPQSHMVRRNQPKLPSIPSLHS